MSYILTRLSYTFPKVKEVVYHSASFGVPVIDPTRSREYSFIREIPQAAAGQCVCMEVGIVSVGVVWPRAVCRGIPTRSWNEPGRPAAELGWERCLSLCDL